MPNKEFSPSDHEIAPDGPIAAASPQTTFAPPDDVPAGREAVVNGGTLVPRRAGIGRAPAGKKL
jgi:hypothetical protein